MKIGLYFGTFNPIHVGHLVIANYMADYTDLDKVWLVVSPQNPLKEKKSLLKDYHRLMMARIATEENNKLHVSNIEFDLARPSYTTDTLAYLSEKYPDDSFALIMGEDNLRTFPKWKNFEHILDHFELYVYPRNLTDGEREELAQLSSEESELKSHPSVKFFNEVPVMKISSSFIRQSIKDGKDARYLLSDPVYQYVTEMQFYKK